MNMEEKREPGPSISRMVCDCQICGSTKLKQVSFLGYILSVNHVPRVGIRGTECFA